ncbi:DUF2848 family protein [Ureibacillus sp. NPDC094379]
MKKVINLHLSNGEVKKHEIDIKKVIVVGYGGRNIKKIQEHIDELAELGIAPPPSVPMIYPQELEQLNFSNECHGSQFSSGEAEYALFHDGNEWLVTLGSDHTDREVEKEDILKSKLVCDKPLATDFWRLADLKEDWDTIILRSYVTTNGEKVLYQEDTLEALLEVDVLLEKLGNLGEKNLEHTVIYSGTVPTKNGFVFGEAFEYEIEQPKLNKKIKHHYSIVN